jgi:hypothetical protein
MTTQLIKIATILMTILIGVMLYPKEKTITEVNILDKYTLNELQLNWKIPYDVV